MPNEVSMYSSVLSAFSLDYKQQSCGSWWVQEYDPIDAFGAADISILRSNYLLLQKSMFMLVSHLCDYNEHKFQKDGISM